MAKGSAKGNAAEQKKEAVEDAIREARKKAEVKREASAEMDGKVNANSKFAVHFVAYPAEGAIKGVCNVTINDEFCVRNVRLVEGSNGRFVAMPSYKSGDEYRDIFFPVTKEARASIQEAVISEYDLQMQIHQADASYGAKAAQEAPMEAPKGQPMAAIQ